MNKKEMNNKGFSLVELIIVIAIMAILVGVLAPQFMKYLESSRQSTDIDSIAAYKTAIETTVIDSAAGDGSIASGSITITGGGGTAASKIKSDLNLESLGLKAANTDTDLKSRTWPTVTYEFKFDSTKKGYFWTTSATSTKNTASPERDIKTVFE